MLSVLYVLSLHQLFAGVQRARAMSSSAQTMVVSSLFYSLLEFSLAAICIEPQRLYQVRLVMAILVVTSKPPANLDVKRTRHSAPLRLRGRAQSNQPTKPVIHFKRRERFAMVVNASVVPVDRHPGQLSSQDHLAVPRLAKLDVAIGVHFRRRSIDSLGGGG